MSQKKWLWLITIIILLISAESDVVGAFQQPNTRPATTENRKTNPVTNSGESKTGNSEIRANELSKEVAKLTQEVRKLRLLQQQLLETLVWQTLQDRAERLQDRLSNNKKAQQRNETLQNQIDSRLRNIDEELRARNIINRQEGERLVRKELEDQLRELRNDQSFLSEEMLLLSKSLTELEQRLDKLQQRFEVEEPEK
jgi:hypothetical protein